MNLSDICEDEECVGSYGGAREHPDPRVDSWSWGLPRYDATF